MVKVLDENLPDHVGIRLLRAYEVWKSEFVGRMNAAGHDWFTPARANLLGHLARAGTPQSVLIERTGVTKQAVQQTVDALVAAGILERVPDPADRRGRIVRYTDAGHAAMADADRIKHEIEAAMRGRLGRSRFDQLCGLLGEIADAD